MEKSLVSFRGNSTLYCGMSKESLICIFGALVFLSPYIGVPRIYKEWLLFGIGVLIMIIGYSLRRKAFLRELDTTGERRSETFVESTKPHNAIRDTENAVRTL